MARGLWGRPRSPAGHEALGLSLRFLDRCSFNRFRKCGRIEKPCLVVADSNWNVLWAAETVANSIFSKKIATFWSLLVLRRPNLVRKVITPQRRHQCGCCHDMIVGEAKAGRATRWRMDFLPPAYLAPEHRSSHKKDNQASFDKGIQKRC